MIKPARPHPEHNRTSDTILQTAGTGSGNPYKGFPNLFRPFFPPFALSYPHILRSLYLPSDDVRERKRKSRPHTPHALTITPVTVSDGVRVERTAQGTRIPDARREHDGRNHHRRLLAPRPADGMEHVRRRGTRRPAYGRNPPYPWRPPRPCPYPRIVVATVTPIPLSDIERTSCGLCGTVRSHGRPIPGHVLTREESIWLQPFASWS